MTSDPRRKRRSAPRMGAYGSFRFCPCPERAKHRDKRRTRRQKHCRRIRVGGYRYLHQDVGEAGLKGSNSDPGEQRGSAHERVDLLDHARCRCRCRCRTARQPPPPSLARSQARKRLAGRPRPRRCRRAPHAELVQPRAEARGRPDGSGDRGDRDPARLSRKPEQSGGSGQGRETVDPMVGAQHVCRLRRAGAGRAGRVPSTQLMRRRL